MEPGDTGIRRAGLGGSLLAGIVLAIAAWGSYLPFAMGTGTLVGRFGPWLGESLSRAWDLPASTAEIPFGLLVQSPLLLLLALGVGVRLFLPSRAGRSGFLLYFYGAAGLVAAASIATELVAGVQTLPAAAIDSGLDPILTAGGGALAAFFLYRPALRAADHEVPFHAALPALARPALLFTLPAVGWLAPRLWYLLGCWQEASDLTVNAIVNPGPPGVLAGILPMARTAAGFVFLLLTPALAAGVPIHRALSRLARRAVRHPLDLLCRLAVLVTPALFLPFLLWEVPGLVVGAGLGPLPFALVVAFGALLLGAGLGWLGFLQVRLALPLIEPEDPRPPSAAPSPGPARSP